VLLPFSRVTLFFVSLGKSSAVFVFVPNEQTARVSIGVGTKWRPSTNVVSGSLSSYMEILQYRFETSRVIELKPTIESLNHG